MGLEYLTKVWGLSFECSKSEQRARLGSFRNSSGLVWARSNSSVLV
ncbi:hypothetical protein UFOVP381_22 [uncultured Caudovirales phage]|uniref:Uncharacterized protein n=1 Tax=uncultured Caudovirales phage TaxID=2100421 RepID=A0A6J7WZP9_9CAUD|nr:hypothetical protein UFOVP381_22 [uncultured Caudovirales phage]